MPCDRGGPRAPRPGADDLTARSISVILRHSSQAANHFAFLSVSLQNDVNLLNAP